MTVFEAFSDFRNHYLLVRGYSQVTIDGYWWVVKSFVEAVGNVDTQQISHDEIIEWLHYMEDRHNTKTTIHTNVSRFRVFIDFMHLEGICPLDKDQIKAPRKPKTLPAYTKSATIDLMIERASSIRDKAIIAVLFSTGLRNSELRHLKRADIQGDEVFVHEGKGLRDRVVRLDLRSQELLGRYLSSRVDSSPYVFISSRQEPVAKSTLRYIVGHTAKIAGLEHVKPHAIRHGTGTFMMQGGAHLRVIQDYLGHSDPKITEIYTHVTVEDVRSAHEQIFDAVHKGKQNSLDYTAKKPYSRR